MIYFTTYFCNAHAYAMSRVVRRIRIRKCHGISILEIIISPIDQRKRKKALFIVRSTDVISLSERKRYPSVAKYLPRDLFRLLQPIGCSSLALVKQVNGRLGCR